jgi:hypothetical protein
MANPKINQKVIGTVVFTKADGTPGEVDGIPTWTSSDENIGSIQNVTTDGMSAEVHGMGVVGMVTITVAADADLGDGTRFVEASGVVVFEPEEVTGATITFGEPMEK